MDKLAPNVFSPIQHRYSLALLEIEDSSPQILDIGGYVSRADLVKKYFQNYDYKSINVGSAWYKTEQSDFLYDGVSLPFCDKAFDYSISVDSIEHVSAEKREDLVKEIIRVAKKKAIIVTPFRKAGSTTDESYLLEVSNRYGIAEMPSLVEHELFGLPTYEQLFNIVKMNNGIIKFATPRSDYWSIQMAMLWNTIALNGMSYDINRKLQTFQEQLLHDQTTTLNINDAYRCVLIFGGD